MAQITGSDELVTKGELKDFYDAILPYLGGMPEALANKFEKSNLYSTTEKIIGCWTDGRPIYQKVFTGTIPQCATTGTGVTAYVSVGSSVSKFVSLRCTAKNSSTKNEIDVSVFAQNTIGLSTSGSTDIKYKGLKLYGSPNDADSSTRNKIAIVNSDTGLNNYSYVLIAQYTKTTDSANSFKYGSETDYSTTEKIVGTWINGKPLYQKTIVDTFPTSGNTKYVSIGATVDWCDSEAVVIAAGAAQKLSTTKTSGTAADWSLRYAVCLNGHSTNPNTVLLNNTGGTSYNNQPVYITLRYTKTTD